MDNANNESRTVKLSDGSVVRVTKYHTERFAIEAAAPGMRTALILGDVDDRYGKWWVVSRKDAARLVRDGYEQAVVTFVR